MDNPSLFTEQEQQEQYEGIKDYVIARTPKLALAFCLSRMMQTYASLLKTMGLSFAKYTGLALIFPWGDRWYFSTKVAGGLHRMASRCPRKRSPRTPATVGTPLSAQIQQARDRVLPLYILSKNSPRHDQGLSLLVRLHPRVALILVRPVS